MEVGFMLVLVLSIANAQLNIALKKLMPILQIYKEKTPPNFYGIYTRGVKEYHLERV